MFVGWLLWGLSGCVSQADLDKATAERDALAGQVDELKQQVAKLEIERDRLRRERDQAVREAEVADAAGRKQRTEEALAAANLRLDQKLQAILQTSEGDIRCELWPDIAPVTVANFVGLAEGTKEWEDPRSGERKKGVPLYDGTIFHRVIPDFMIQGGDPLGSGRGGPGYQFEDEVQKDVRFDQPGLLAMANAGPGTNGSQFFITDSTPHHLNMRHTIFGKCELPVVKKILGKPTGPGDRPVETVTIKHISIQRS